MSLGSHLVLAGVSFTVGMCVWSVAATDTPQVRVIHADKPIVKTHVVHDTQTITTPLPDSCKRVLAMAQDVSTSASTIDSLASKTQLKLGDVTVQVIENPNSVNKLNTYFINAKSKMDDALLPALDASSLFETRIDQCNTDIAHTD